MGSPTLDPHDPATAFHLGPEAPRPRRRRSWPERILIGLVVVFLAAMALLIGSFLLSSWNHDRKVEALEELVLPQAEQSGREAGEALLAAARTDELSRGRIRAVLIDHRSRPFTMSTGAERIETVAQVTGRASTPSFWMPAWGHHRTATLCFRYVLSDVGSAGAALQATQLPDTACKGPLKERPEKVRPVDYGDAYEAPERSAEAAAEELLAAARAGELSLERAQEVMNDSEGELLALKSAANRFEAVAEIEGARYSDIEYSVRPRCYLFVLTDVGSSEVAVQFEEESYTCPRLWRLPTPHLPDEFPSGYDPEAVAAEKRRQAELERKIRERGQLGYDESVAAGPDLQEISGLLRLAWYSNDYALTGADARRALAVEGYEDVEAEGSTELDEGLRIGVALSDRVCVFGHMHGEDTDLELGGPMRDGTGCLPGS